jgi:hypothetical protein
MSPSSSTQKFARPSTNPTGRSDASLICVATGNNHPRNWTRSGKMPRDHRLHYVGNLSGPKPFKTYLREHSPGVGS